MDLMAYLSAAKRSLFRYEYLQDFSAVDKEGFEEWQRSGSIEEAKLDEWIAFLEKKHKEGVTTQRVRRVVLPLNAYTRYELAVHRIIAQYGDDIRVVTDDAITSLAAPAFDFWLIDETIALKMLYGERGVFLGIEKQSDPEPYLRAMGALLSPSVPVDHFAGEP